MTWNVQGKFVKKTIGGVGRLFQTVASYNPDIIGLQEVEVGEAKGIASRLGWKHVYWKPVHNAGGIIPPEAEGMAILSRYQMADTSIRELTPRARDDHGRHLMRAVVNIRGQEIHFYNTHLTNKGEQTAQARRAVELIDQDKRMARAPFIPILVGDLNGQSNHPAVRSLADAMTDAWASKNPPEHDNPVCLNHDQKNDAPLAPVFCGHTGPTRRNNKSTMKFWARNPYQRIDYIFLGKEGGQTVDSIVVPPLDRDVDGKALGFLSDHLPVVATILGLPLNPSARVVYRGKDNHIYELLLPSGRGWVWSDLTEITDAQNATDDPAAYVTGQDAVRVIYRGTDDHIHELLNAPDGSWQHEDLHKLAGIGGKRLLADPLQRAVQADTRPHIHA
jgi:endonuclease/exonuclease/phosphatase family metal-dependent hydrolase